MPIQLRHQTQKQNLPSAASHGVGLPISDGGLGAASRALGQVAGAAGNIGARLQQKKEAVDTSAAARYDSARGIERDDALAGIDKLINEDKFKEAESAFDAFSKKYGESDLNEWGVADSDPEVPASVSQRYNLRNNELMADYSRRFEAAILSKRSHFEKTQVVKGAGTTVRSFTGSADMTLAPVPVAIAGLEQDVANALQHPTYLTSTEEGKEVFRNQLAPYYSTLVGRSETALKLEPNSKNAKAVAKELISSVTASPALNSKQKEALVGRLGGYLESRKEYSVQTKQLARAQYDVTVAAAKGTPVAEDDIIRSNEALSAIATDTGAHPTIAAEANRRIAFNNAVNDFDRKRYLQTGGKVGGSLDKDTFVNMGPNNVREYHAMVGAFQELVNDAVTNNEQHLIPLYTGEATKSKFDANQGVIDQMLRGVLTEGVEPLTGPFSTQPIIEDFLAQDLNRDSVERTHGLLSAIYGTTADGYRALNRELESSQNSDNPDRAAFGSLFSIVANAPAEQQDLIYETIPYLADDYKFTEKMDIGLTSTTAEARDSDMETYIQERGSKWEDLKLSRLGSNAPYADTQVLEAMYNAQRRRIAQTTSYESVEQDIKQLEQTMDSLYTVVPTVGGKDIILPTPKVPELFPDGLKGFALTGLAGLQTAGSAVGSAYDAWRTGATPFGILEAVAGGTEVYRTGYNKEEFGENLSAVYTEEIISSYDIKGSDINQFRESVEALSGEPSTVWDEAKKALSNQFYGEHALPDLIELGEKNNKPIFTQEFNMAGPDGDPVIYLNIIQPIGSSYRYMPYLIDGEPVTVKYADIIKKATDRAYMSDIEETRYERDPFTLRKFSEQGGQLDEAGIPRSMSPLSGQ